MIFKIRASGAGKLMTDSKVKSDPIGETAKKYLKAQWIQDNYNREKDIVTPAIQKGLLNEESGITMLCEHLGEFLTKNETHMQDDFMQGTCDVVTEDMVYDIKCSRDIFTFGNCEITKDYLYQLQVYMHLWNKKQSNLVYVLTDTPDSLIHGEVRSILWKLQEQSSPGELRYDEIYEGIRKDWTYQDVSPKDRIKIFPVSYDENKIKELIEKVKLCREYYNNLTL